MKNSIFIKFLAILLCAVSLTGIIGGAAGALVLAKEDLYNRTVDQMLAEKVRDDANIFADQAALSYASRSLGGCPDEMVQRYSIPSGYDFGYTILDAEGNVLESRNPERKENAEIYSFPVTGQYMHLVSLETETEKLARETAQRMDAIGRLQEDQNGQTLPPEGVPVNQVIFTDRQGAPIYEACSDSANCYSIFYYSEDGNVRGSSRYEQQPQQQIGFLYYGTDSQLMYRSFLEEQDHNFTSAEVCGVLFLSHESGFLFQDESADGLGTLQFENGHLLFSGHSPEEAAPVETIPETTAETTAETLPEETAPVETVPVETAPAETVPETPPAEEPPAETEAPAEEAPAEETYPPEEEASSASAVPEEEYAEEEYIEEYVEEAAETEAPPAPETQPPETLPPETLPPETIPQETMPEEAAVEETLPQSTEPVLINGKPLEFYQVNRTEYHSSTTGELTTAKYVYLSLPEITVEVYADRNSLGNEAIYDGLRLIRQYRQFLLPVIGICLLIFAVCVVYLCTAAGRNPKSDEVRAGGLNRLPLDLYLGLSLLAGTGMIALAITVVPTLLGRNFPLGCSVAAISGFSCCLLSVGFLFACLAQCKTPDGLWWRNLLTIRFVFLSMRLMKKLEAWLRETAFPWLGWLLKISWAKLWKALVWLYETTEKLTAKAGRVLNRFFSQMPLTWQWLLGGFATILFTLLINAHNFLLVLLGILIPIAIVLYVSHCYGILLATTRKMGKGDLDTKIKSKLLVGSFQDFAKELNDLADVAKVAAQKQLKSERMKTELITNVSHDIKTPLTSIINYVDLLQKPHTEKEGAQYLEVLDRQSQRLKKLVDDLMDMSKASTGNMSLEITRVDAVEAVNQALGEFSDKLERARLYPVFRHTVDSAPIMADGKLVWRILSNLLGNTVKYAMPGTRVYLDLNRIDGNVVISLKNISSDELNIDAEELMERFVRGDISRNTDGSGLGLNIAKSLMELQNGHLQLLVDGDLFKVTLIFPDAK